MKTTLLFCILFLGSFQLLAAERTWQLKTGFDYFNTTQNFDTEGNIDDLFTGQYFTHMRFNGDFIYRYNRYLNFIGSLEGAYGESFRGTDTRTNFNITNFAGGAEYILSLGKSSAVALGFIQNITPNAVDVNTDQVILSDGVMDSNLYFDLYTSIQRFGLRVKGGYHARDDGTANLGRFLGEIQYRYLPFIVGLGYEGIISATDDQFVNSPISRTTVTDRVNGGSFKFYNVNPKLSEINLWGLYSQSPSLAFQVGLKHTIEGRSSAAGSTIYFNLFYSSKNNSYQTEFIRLASHGKTEEGEFKINPTQYEEEQYFVPDPNKKKKRKKKRLKKRKKKRILDEV
ncbi:MAG: hypothetical protein AB8E15_07725 [Bdellovibrionales bacterium]